MSQPVRATAPRLLRLPFLLIGACVAVWAQDSQPGRELLVWDCDDSGGVSGLQLESSEFKQGTAAVRWRDHPSQPGFDVPGTPSDWTGYNLLRLWVHCRKSVPTDIMLLVRSENEDTDGPDYWGYRVRLRFSGWREFVFPIGQRTGARVPRGWNQIDSLAFTASGWGNSPHPEADLLIDDIRLEYTPPQSGPRLTDREFFAQLDLMRPGLETVRTAVEAGDLGRAKDAFLAYMRSRTAPSWWFDWRDRPTPEHRITGGSEGWDYFATGITIDWTGWKLVRLPLAEWTKARSPVGWHHINHLSFSGTYGDRTPHPDTGLVLDDVRLEGTDPASLGAFETPADFLAWPGLRPTREQVKSGKSAGLWASVRSVPGIRCSVVPGDWTGFEALLFWAYSAAATGDRITLIAESETPNVTRAEAILKHVYGGHHLGDDIDWETNKTDPADPAFTKEWTYGLNRFRHWRDLGKAYWATGDERFAAEWAAQVRDWVEDHPLPLYGTGNDTLIWRTIEAGIRASTTWPDSLQYFLGSPSVTADDMVTFIKSWIEHARHLMRITVDYPEHGGNWVTMECNGLGHLGVLLPECKEAPTWLKTAVDRLTQELGRQVYPDGAQKELTTGYHQVARRNFVDLYRIARHNGLELPAEYLGRLERMYEYNLKAMTPEGRLPPLNDAGYTGVLDSMEEGAKLFGRQDFLWAATRGFEGEAPAYTSVAFPYAGQYVMRSGWSADDRYLLFESGPFGIGHQHEDKLTLFAYAYGRVLLTEAGTYSYDASKYRRYVLGTWAHNTVLVDGLQQHRSGLRSTYETGEPLSNLWLHNDVFDAADGVYADGYGPKRSVKVAHERTVVFVRPDYWVVVDRLLGEGRHTYDVLWHLNNDAADTDAGTQAAWGADEGVPSLLVTPAGAEGLELEIVTGRHDPVLGFAPTRRKKPIPVLDYRRNADGPLTLAWVLTPFRAGPPPVRATLQPADQAATVTIRHSTGTDVVFVAKRGESGELAPGTTRTRGRVAVVRMDTDGKILASRGE